MNFLTSFRALSPTTSAHRSLDQFFNNRYRRLIDSKRVAEDDINLPLVNIEQQQNAYYVEVSMPGFRKSDIEISLEKDVMHISATRGNSANEEHRQYLHQEFKTQHFYRSFHLPENTDQDQIKAKYEDGILHIIIPLIPAEETPEIRRMITVE
ncbi:MAG: Hsp20/alpha crystallin family protein [Bacteroidetes bacterium]|nr:MAG: Hsp20/alpha crystallin family protein [Bacteroidota bacterium]